jgi:hypothetical protein
VNAFILTHTVPDALTFRRRRRGGKWQTIGVSDALRLETVNACRDGDAVAQPSNRPLNSGMKVVAVRQ